MSQKNELNAAPQHPAPRFANGWAALVYALATLTLAYPALAGSFLVNVRSDQYMAGYAFREFAAASLRAGNGFPQWNPYLQGGMPYIAAMHGDIFYPTFLLRMAMPTDQAMTWGFIIHLFLAGLFTFGFLRALGVGFYGALIGGLAYMLSGPIAGFASPGHDGKLFVSALLPLTLWLLLLLVRDGRPWAWGALAIAIGLAVLSPHPQLLQYLLLASGAFALFVALSSNALGQRLPGKVAVTRLGSALVAVVIGGLIGAVQFLPVAEYVPWSPRAGGKGYEHAVSFSLPLEELFNTVVPQFSGMLDSYWGQNGIHLHSEYAGIVVLTLAAAGMFISDQRKGVRWFWISTLIVSLLWALGGSTPFYHLIYAVVPGAKYFRAPSTMMFVTMFCIAVLAAYGAERVLAAASAIPRRFLWSAAGILGGICVLCAIGLPTLVADGLANRLSAAGYPSNVVARTTDLARLNQASVVWGSLRSLVFLSLGLALIWFWRVRLTRDTAAWILAGLVALDLWSIARKYWIFSEPAAVLYAADPALEIMRAAKEPGRVFQWDPLEARVFHDPAFLDVVMTHRLRAVMGYHGNELGRFQELLGKASLRPEFLRHENIHYLYTTLPDSLMPQLEQQIGTSGFRKLAGPLRNTAGSTVYLYRVPGENPAAWVATAMVKGTDEQALATVLDPRFEPERAAILDTAAAVQVLPLTTAPRPAGVKANVTRYEPGRIDVRLDKPTAAGAALVVSENFYPGWHASADGKDATVARANYNLIGVALPPGTRQVQLRFTDPAYGTGKTVTLIALAFSLTAVLAGAFLQRRQPAVAT
jgi:hypothetical protein